MWARKELFKFNMKYLLVVGLWPGEHWSKRQKIMYKIYEITLHFLTICFLVTTGIGTYKHKHEIIVFLANLDKTIVAYDLVFKLVFFILKRDHLRSLLSEMETSGDTLTEKRKRLMANSIIFISMFASSIVGAFSLLAQYKFEMAVEAWMPFDPLKNRANLLLSAGLLAITFVMGLYRSLAMQGILCSMMMYMCDQLVDLQNMLRSLTYSTRTEVEMRNKFDEIIKKHVRLMRYAKEMDIVFKGYFLSQNLTFTMKLCFTAIMVTVVGLKQKDLLISFLAYIMLALLNSYVYCYLGGEMIIQGEGVAIAAYETSWTSWPVELQKDLLLIIKAAQKPIKLSAGGMSPMCIPTFSQAVCNGYSFFAVLNDVID